MELDVRAELVRDIVKRELNAVNRPELFPVIMAIIEVESSFNPFAIRYEPHYRWLYKPEEFYRLYTSTEETEIILQKCSIGLMQVMGAVFRELGYRKPLTMLFTDISAQIHYGIKHFSRFYIKYGRNIPYAVASYNAGSPRMTEDGKFINQPYVDKVLQKMERWKT